MNKSKEKIINNYKEDRSSALYLDIRNSTQILRSFRSFKHIRFHADFMWEVKKLIFQDDPQKVATNDTGDGFVALFWDDRHAWRALRIAVGIRELLNRSKQKYNQFLKNELKRSDLHFGFGIALHSGGSIVYQSSTLKRDFIYGVVVNTTARLESFTKTFLNCNLLFSGHFKDVLEIQTKHENEAKGTRIVFKNWEKKNIRLVTSDRVDIKDAKQQGHKLYTVTDNNHILKLSNTLRKS